MYTALLLDAPSQLALRNHFRSIIPANWDVKCHHMTVSMQRAASSPAAQMVGQEFDILVTSLAHDEKVMAVGIETLVPSANAVKHITIAVNIADGGKPKHSNELKNWSKLPTPITLKGTVQEIQ